MKCQNLAKQQESSEVLNQNEKQNLQGQMVKKVDGLRKIKNFDYYFIDNRGNIYSLNKRNNMKEAPKKMMLLKPCKHKAGHLKLDLVKDGKIYKKWVHRLVLETFVSVAPDGMECMHIDGNAENNNIENLRWGTRKENLSHRIIHGTDNRGEKNKTSKLKNKDVSMIKNLLLGGKSQQEIANKFKVSRTCISAIATNRSWAWIAQSN